MIHDLGTVPGDLCSRATSVNSKGQVVGGSSDCHNFLHAFLWEEDGPMIDLNTLIPPNSGLQLTHAVWINDRGEIVAHTVPLGVPPIDDEILGHTVLLIPCDGTQTDIKGCQDDGREIAVGSHVTAPAVAERTIVRQENPQFVDPAAGVRTRLAQRHGILVPATRPKE